MEAFGFVLMLFLFFFGLVDYYLYVTSKGLEKNGKKKNLVGNKDWMKKLAKAFFHILSLMRKMIRTIYEKKKKKVIQEKDY